MPEYFANPLGFFGLLALPAIVLIHFLREKSRRLRVSTLFLLEELAPRTPRGQTLHRLQNSVPLWLQLLIALLCTWLLVEPRWVRRESTQRVSVILDDTASMEVSRERVRRGLRSRLAEVARAAGRTEWVVRTSSEPASPLYRGLELEAAVAALDRWQPVTPHHDAERAFGLTLLEARAGGAVLYVSDRPPPSLPAGVTLLAFGEPIANCGFAGLRAWQEADGAHWQALVKNFGASPQERRWWIATAGEQSAQALSLAPGQIETISGTFDESGRIEIRLSADDFGLDDVLPIVVPKPKPLLVFIDAPTRTTDALVRLLATVPGTRRVTDPGAADVVVTPVAESIPAGKAAIIFAPSGPANAKVATGAITTEAHPWLAGLGWNGLLSSGAGPLVMAPSDEGLIWQAGKPLAFLRGDSNGRALVVNFDVENSNASRLPVFVLMLGRFLADVAAQKPAPFADNFATLQLLPTLPDDAEIAAPGDRPIPGKSRTAPRAPALPGFFEIRSSGGRLVDAAAHFGDPRESDFRDCGHSASSLEAAGLVRQENLSGDRFATLWLVLIGAALGGSWAAQASRRSDEV